MPIEDYLTYIRNLWPVTKPNKTYEVKYFKIILTDMSLADTFIRHALAEKVTISKNYERFVLNKNIIALSTPGSILFYPMQDRNFPTYPTILRQMNTFFLFTGGRDALNKHLFWGLLQEIYISSYELEGWTLYHGNGLIIKDRMVLIVGEAGFGKSTLSAGLSLNQKAAIISDDRIFLRGKEGAPVPSFMYLDKRMYEASLKLKSLPPLDWVNHSNEKIPTSLMAINDFHDEASTNHQTNIFVQPYFNVNYNGNYLIEHLSHGEIYKILIQNCLTVSETWRRKYMFKSFLKESEVKDKCLKQSLLVSRSIPGIRINFGPDTNYADLFNFISGI